MLLVRSTAIEATVTSALLLAYLPEWLTFFSLKVNSMPSGSSVLAQISFSTFLAHAFDTSSYTFFLLVFFSVAIRRRSVTERILAPERKTRKFEFVDTTQTIHWASSLDLPLSLFSTQFNLIAKIDFLILNFFCKANFSDLHPRTSPAGSSSKFNFTQHPPQEHWH